MKYISATHFWDWFSQFDKTLLKLPAMKRAEKDYWLRELFTHLRALRWQVRMEIHFRRDCEIPYVFIDTEDNVNHFARAEKFVDISPHFSNWFLYTSRPPAFYDDKRFTEMEVPDVDMANLWFDPALDKAYNGKIILHVYNERAKYPAKESIELVDRRVCNLLGEKTWFLEVAWVEVTNMSFLSARKRKTLVPITEIADHLTVRSTNIICIDGKGYRCVDKEKLKVAEP